MSNSGYTWFAQAGKPYDSCWNWNTHGGGTQFAARASKWAPVTDNDQDLRCLPDVFPAEYQMINMAPSCAPQECSGCKQKGSCAGNIAVTGGSCTACKSDFMTLLNGNIPNEGITRLINPLIYHF
jgi:hypothetical protein